MRVFKRSCDFFSAFSSGFIYGLFRVSFQVSFRVSLRFKVFFGFLRFLFKVSLVFHFAFHLWVFRYSCVSSFYYFAIIPAYHNFFNLQSAIIPVPHSLINLQSFPCIIILSICNESYPS